MAGACYALELKVDEAIHELGLIPADMMPDESDAYWKGLHEEQERREREES